MRRCWDTELSVPGEQSGLYFILSDIKCKVDVLRAEIFVKCYHWSMKVFLIDTVLEGTVKACTPGGL